MNLFGPSLNSVPYGYIEYLFTYRNGTNIANNYAIRLSNLTYLNNYSSPTRFSMTIQTSVSSAPANNTNDFSIRMRFKVGLFSQLPTPANGASLPFRMEALLTPRITVNLSMIVSSNCPIQNDAVTFIRCPSIVDYGGFYEYSVDFFISRPIGDYTFSFSTDEFSASIGNMFLSLPPTFAVFPESYRTNTEEKVTWSAVLTTYRYLSVTNLQNLGVYDTSLPIANRSVRLTVYIAIYTISLSVVKFVARVSPTGQNSTMNVCESRYSKYTNFNSHLRNLITVRDTPVFNRPETIQYFTVQVIIRPSTTGSYVLTTQFQGKMLGENCYVDYLLPVANGVRKIRLITDFSYSSKGRTSATTYIGTFVNANAFNLTYNFQVGIKLNYDTTYVLGDVVRIDFVLRVPFATVFTQSATFPITSMAQPTSTVPLSRTPLLTIERVVPRNSQPMVNFTTIVEVRAKFIQDFVYMPVIFQLQVNPTEANILRQNFQTIGYLIQTVAPVAFNLAVRP
ncbi:unnamed protein product [Schistosoma turkestanicum]|nr:unnamed protein product [Schistosoma turkestanicum]